jgi:hypothetical protein
MDGDLQNDPKDIPRLVRKLAEGYDLVVGYRMRRQDRLLTRRLPSWVANRIIGAVTGIHVRDNGCSLKAYRRDLLDRLHLYSDMHRFIPAAAAATAGARIAEIPVRHHARRFGTSKYGLTRILKVVSDLLTIKMIRSFRSKPLALFALGALATVLLAVAFAGAAAVALLFFGLQKANALVLPGAALLLVGCAFYLLMLGLLAEVVVEQGRRSDSELPPLLRQVVP